MRGGQWQVLYLLRGLQSQGHEVVLCTPTGSKLGREVASETKAIRIENLSLSTLGKLTAVAEVVHVHDAKSHTWAALLSKRPFVVSRRVAFPPKTGFSSRWKYAKAAHYIAVSRFVANQLAVAGIPESKVTVVYDGVPIPSAVLLPDERKEDCIVAPESDDPRKGSALASKGAKLAGVTLQFSKTLREDLPAADGMLYVSEAEGLGSAILLALAFGTPVVASRVGGIPEIVEHGVTGLLTANDAEEIGFNLRRLKGETRLRRSMGIRGRREAEARFSDTRMVAETLEVYRRVMG